MKITVIEQSHRFFLAFDKWKPAVGHEIKVGKYRFCAIPLKDGINVSEITSVTKVLTIPMSIEILVKTASKEETLKFLEKVGKQLQKIIEQTSNFDQQLIKMKTAAFERLGNMPPIEKFDTDWIMADISDVLN